VSSACHRLPIRAAPTATTIKPSPGDSGRLGPGCGAVRQGPGASPGARSLASAQGQLGAIAHRVGRIRDRVAARRAGSVESAQSERNATESAQESSETGSTVADDMARNDQVLAAIAGHPFVRMVADRVTPYLTRDIETFPKERRAQRRWARKKADTLTVGDRYALETMRDVHNLTRPLEQMERARYLIRRSPTSLASFGFHTTSVAAGSTCSKGPCSARRARPMRRRGPDATRIVWTSGDPGGKAL